MKTERCTICGHRMSSSNPTDSCWHHQKEIDELFIDYEAKQIRSVVGSRDQPLLHEESQNWRNQ